MIEEIWVNCGPGNEQQGVAKLQGKKPVLKRVSDSIPWESLRPLLERGYT
jgi:hypothetical protein